jgi:K+-transporting ATPase ATPase A chain
MVMVALLGAFITGLMIGRTPEFLGKHLGPPELKLITLFNLVTPLAVLLPTALAVVTHAGTAGLTTNAGPHGLTEIAYAYASSTANNGQTMAGLSANSVFYNLTTMVAMLLGRFGLALPALALAGRFAAQKPRPDGPGTLPIDTPMFLVIMVVTAVVVTGLSFLPMLSLGPIAEAMR